MVSSRFCRRSRTFCTVLFLCDSGSGKENRGAGEWEGLPEEPGGHGRGTRPYLPEARPRAGHPLKMTKRAGPLKASANALGLLKPQA